LIAADRYQVRAALLHQQPLVAAWRRVVFKKLVRPAGIEPAALRTGGEV
jgi:hypothetical protein